METIVKTEKKVKEMPTLTKRNLVNVRAIIKGLSEEKRKARRRKYDNSSKYSLRRNLRVFHLVYAFLQGKTLLDVEKTPLTDRLKVELAAHMWIQIELLSKNSLLGGWNIWTTDNQFQPRQFITTSVILDWLDGKAFFAAPVEPVEKGTGT